MHNHSGLGAGPWEGLGPMTASMNRTPLEGARGLTRRYRCTQPAKVEYLIPATAANLTADIPLCSNLASTALRCSLETRKRPLESVVTRTPSAGEHAREVDSTDVVDVIAITTMITMRISARGATRDAYRHACQAIFELSAW